MSNNKLILKKLIITGKSLKISLDYICSNVFINSNPKLKIFFTSDSQTRRIPVVFSDIENSENGIKVYHYEYSYSLNDIFLNPEQIKKFSANFEIQENNNYITGVFPEICDNTEMHLESRFYSVNLEKNGNIIFNVKSPISSKNQKSGIKEKAKNYIKSSAAIILLLIFHPYISLRYKIIYNKKDRLSILLKKSLDIFIKNTIKYYSKKRIKQNRIAFISTRRTCLDGNEKLVYEYLSNDGNIYDFRFLFFEDPIKYKEPKIILKFLKLYLTSGVVIVDDYVQFFEKYKKRNGVTVVQLWHACGAFKVFGFSRLGKKVGAPVQHDKSHRVYDIATVSSENVRKYYAEGFGISDKNVIADGIPRTDCFFDESYIKQTKSKFYKYHPELLNKKIILYAPTFRSPIKKTAYFPIDKFNPENLIDKLGNDYAIIIKLHPFCKERYTIKKEYSNSIIDLSDKDELNDLLFVTDILITDYSSAVFEASLLNIPMLFYSFDLDEYISERDFYTDYISFVPGKIVKEESDISLSIQKNDFEQKKIDEFKRLYCDSLDGKSTKKISKRISEIALR